MNTAVLVDKVWSKIPHHLRNQALQNGLYPALRLRALNSAIQYVGFDLLAGLVPGTQRVERERDWQLLKEFGMLSRNLLREDAALFQEEILPIAALWTTSPFFTPGEFIDFVLDGLHIYRRRRARRHLDLPSESENYPDYYRRNFHFQTDGYFSTKSAARYDRQVDLLFGGTSEAMRRLWVRPLLQQPGMPEARLSQGKALRVLEIGCGAGSASVSFLGVFPECDFTGLDLSVPYLEYAEERFSPDYLKALGRESGKPIQWISANAEALPSELQGMDIISSVFMFHELPLGARKNVIAEAFKALKPGGFFVFIDAIQKGELEAADRVLPTFPRSYHEPFFTDYTNHPMESLITEAGFEIAHAGVGLLSKFVIAKKPLVS